MAEREMPVLDPGDSIRKSGNYPSNSYIAKDSDKKKSSATEKKFTSPKTNTAVKKKKSLKRKFYDVFLGDPSKDAIRYIVNDVLLPAIKSTFYDMITGGLQMRLWGDVSQRRRPSGSSYGQNSYVRYDKISYQDQKREPSRRTRAMHEFDEITFGSKAEAVDIRDSLVDAIDQYGAVTVADFYDLIGTDSNPSDRDWGWNNLSAATVSYTPDGWIINFPKTIPLK